MAHQPSLKQLRYLCAVAEERHFGNAARACHVSQSTLSAGVRELEILLDAALVERSNKQVMLTDLGNIVWRRAQKILIDVEDLMAECERQTRPLAGNLRLGVIPTIAPYSLPDLLQNVRRDYPELKLYIREDMSAPLVERLLRGELDLLLLALPFPANGCATMDLYEDRFFVAVHPGHQLYDESVLDIGRLPERDLLLLEDGHCLRDHALDACQLDIRDLEVPYQATSLGTVVQMVANGIGITLLPEMSIRSGILADTPVRTIPFDSPRIARRIGLMWRESSPRTAEFELFGRFIRQVCAPGVESGDQRKSRDGREKRSR